MNFMHIVKMLSENLIITLFFLLAMLLFIRYLAYRSGQVSKAYFNQFSRAVQHFFEDGQENIQVGEDIDRWMKEFLDKVVEHLPDRTLRFGFKIDGDKNRRSLRGESLKEYTSGKRSIVLSIRQQLDAFKSTFPPNFALLTRRVLDQDHQWRTLLGIIPIDSLSRIFNITPGLFLVGGIFGTFLGITSALPKIASINMNNLSAAAPILSSFVGDIAFSMNTSLTGILCSVTMTILIALFPLDSVRNDVKRNMERSFEQIWYQIHGGNISAGERQIVNELKNIQAIFKENHKNSSKHGDS